MTYQAQGKLLKGDLESQKLYHPGFEFLSPMDGIRRYSNPKICNFTLKILQILLNKQASRQYTFFL